MNKTVIRAGAGVVAVIVAAVAFWLIRPLFVDTVVDEAFPLSSQAVVPADMTQDEVEAEMVVAADAADVEEVEEMPAGEPTALASGPFAGVDDFHMGEGTATIYTIDGGTAVLRLEDFSVTNGPDLRVYLAPLVDGQPVITPEAVNLGQLKGNVGNQNYDIPADFDINQPLGVVIYCQPFSVTFATAPLA